MLSASLTTSAVQLGNRYAYTDAELTLVILDAVKCCCRLCHAASFCESASRIMNRLPANGLTMSTRVAVTATKTDCVGHAHEWLAAVAHKLDRMNTAGFRRIAIAIAWLRRGRLFANVAIPALAGNTAFLRVRYPTKTNNQNPYSATSDTTTHFFRNAMSPHANPHYCRKKFTHSFFHWRRANRPRNKRIAPILINTNHTRRRDPACDRYSGNP